MADNKKTKTDFSSGLKAAAEKLKPRDLRKDVLTITIGGVPTPIARGDMDDAAWANVVKQSIKEAKPDEYKQPFSDKGAEALPAKVTMDGEAAKLTEEDESSYNAALDEPTDPKAQAEADALASDNTKTQQASFDKKAELDKQAEEWANDYRNRFSKEEQRELFYMTHKERKAYARGLLQNQQVAESEAPPKKAPVSKPAAPEAPSRERDRDLEDLQPEASNTPNVRNPASFVPSLMTGAKPSPTGNPMLDAVKEKVAPMEGGFPGASNPAPMEGGFPGAPSIPQGGGQSPINFDALPAAQGAPTGTPAGINFDQALPQGGPVGRILAPDQGAWPGAITDAQAATLPPSPNAVTGAPVSSPAALPLPPPGSMPGAGGSVSASASRSGGGAGFNPTKVDPALVTDAKTARAAAMQSHKDAQDRIEAEAEIQMSISNKAARVQATEMANAERLGALAIEAQQNAVTKAENWSAARVQASQAARDAAANPIDPNRYWNNKSEGQRAMAVVAGALYGFLGQGMDWLKRIDGLVDADNRLQATDRASKVEGLKAYSQEMGAQADDALRYGLTRAQSYTLQRVQKLEGLKAQLDMLAMKQTDSVRRQDGMMKSAALGAHINQIADNGLQIGQATARDENTNKFHNAQLSLQREELAAKIAIAEGKEGGKGGRPLPEAGAKLMDEYSSALQTLKDMKAKLANSGVGDRLLQKLAQSNWTPGNESEKTLAKDYEALKFKWMTIMAKGALQGIEIEKLENLLPARGQLMSDPSKQIDSGIDTARESFRRAVRQQRQAGFDMSRFETDPLFQEAAPLRTERPAQ